MAFKRINFFKGFFTRADDWQAAEKYHLEKRKLHNITLHQPGVVHGLGVTAAANGLAVKVAAGYAIDALGQDVILERDVELPISFDDYKSRAEPTTLYIVAEATSDGVDFRDNQGNPELSGYAFIEESAKIGFLVEPPHPQRGVLLAKIRLSKDANRVQNAVQSAAPEVNEIDLVEVKRAGAVAARVSMRDVATQVVAGVTKINAHSGTGSTDYEFSVTWPAASEGHAFHFSSVYPVEGDGQLSWRMGSVREKGELKYTLFVRNHESRQLKVAYRVYRID